MQGGSLTLELALSGFSQRKFSAASALKIPLNRLWWKNKNVVGIPTTFLMTDYLA
jgi:hypothetical protein